ncbi:hypothetical protein IP87_00290 [beta proteobacterium AAP121]|nr:hypothetical protein IP80_13265 [beta proteobacterium AAP65]KPG01107.1 hypothetical protein IP87_00290 [beta proteobacterium AAP121]
MGWVSVPTQHAAYAERAARECVGTGAGAQGPGADTLCALAQAHPAPQGRYTMYRCQHCALEFADPMLSPPAAWYGALYGALPLYPADRWEYGQVLQALGPPDTVLDHGCGSGHFLGLAAGRVRRAIGIDFSPAGVAAVRRRGLEAHVAAEGAADGIALSEPASHITAFHVLEHLPRPAALFELARALGTPSVQLWVAVPSDRRPDRLSGEADDLDAPPHHLTRWTPRALQALGEREGWQLRALHHEPLPWRQCVWEVGRRSRPVAALLAANPWPRPLRRGLARLAALALWAWGRHPMDQASGFSMLARYTLNR